MRGYIDASFYCLFTAISFTFIDKLDDSMNPFISLFFMSIMSSLFFNTINYKHIKKMFRACINNKISYLIMGLSISINWLSSIFAPNVSDPFIYLTISFTTMAIFGFVFIKKNKAIDYYVCSLSILALVLTLAYLHVHYYMDKSRSLNFGFIIGIISGIAAYAYGYSSNKLAKDSEMNALQTLAVRFWPLIILLFVIIKYKHISISISLSDFNILLFMSVFTMIVPNYFNQSSLIKLGVAKRSMFIIITPLLTFIIYSLSMKNFNIENSILAIIITLVLVFSKTIPIIVNKFINRN